MTYVGEDFKEVCTQTEKHAQLVRSMLAPLLLLRVRAIVGLRRERGEAAAKRGHAEEWQAAGTGVSDRATRLRTFGRRPLVMESGGRAEQDKAEVLVRKKWSLELGAMIRETDTPAGLWLRTGSADLSSFGAGRRVSTLTSRVRFLRR